MRETSETASALQVRLTRRTPPAPHEHPVADQVRDRVDRGLEVQS